MIGRFEWHITVGKVDGVETRKIADTGGWVFSEITGCPILGQGDYCYLTGYDRDYDTALAEMRRANAALAFMRIKSLRMKIEDIVYDTKTGVSRLDEGERDGKESEEATSARRDA